MALFYCLFEKLFVNTKNIQYLVVIHEGGFGEFDLGSAFFLPVSGQTPYPPGALSGINKSNFSPGCL
jgi:hypothetical protein